MRGKGRTAGEGPLGTGSTVRPKLRPAARRGGGAPLAAKG
jgi:hypothetical protein